MAHRKASGKSDDVAVLARSSGVLFLLSQPEGDAPHDQQDDREVEGVTHRHEDGFEGPRDEFADGCDEVLKIHGRDLLRRI